MPGSYLLGILDSAGKYMESLWSGSNCTGSQVMLAAPSYTTSNISNSTGPDDKDYSFSSLGNTKNGLIFAAPNGTLIEVGRGCGWWIGDCGQTKIWSLIGSLHAMILKS